jgi:hypothetical protein
MPRELPEFNTFPHSHENIFFLPKEKEARKSKESCPHSHGNISSLPNEKEARK